MLEFVPREDTAIVDGDPEAVARPCPGLNQDPQESVVYISGERPAEELMVVNRIAADEKP